MTTDVTSIGGTVLVNANQTESPLAILPNSQMAVQEETVVSTDDSSLAVLTFFEDSTVTLYGNTTVLIHQSNKPRFNLSNQSPEIEIELVRGRIRAAPIVSDTQLIFRVRTPEATSLLAEGSYAVESNDSLTQVSTRQGVALVDSQGQQIELATGQRSIIQQGEPPSPATEAEQNLIVNGDFQAPISEAWAQDIFIPSNAVDVISATATIDQFGEQNVVIFRSQGQDNIHTDAAIEQRIDKDVRDFQSLRINADIRLNLQSLPGGGFQGSEYPVLIQLSYKDDEGNDREWYRGFYYETPPSNYILLDQVDNSSERITRNLWYPYESENLLTTLADIKPVYVKSIRIYASGWIYNAMVTDIQLLAQE
ncbi:MAG: FecR family protein [Chloroflexota bacterium]